MNILNRYILKKFIVVFVLICTGLTVDAQIQRKFFGFELGVASKEQVKNYFRNEGFTVSSIDDGEVIQVLDVRFADQTWDAAFFSFFKGKLYQVMFMVNEVKLNKGTLNELDGYLRGVYKKKYRNYFLKTFPDGSIYYGDNNTVLRYLFENFQESRGINLTYYDKKLFNQKADNIENDL